MSVLITGASIAGLTAAYRLHEIGETVTVVERNPDLRRAGSPIDIRGDALGVAERLGVLAGARANRVQSSDRTAFTTWVDRDSRPVAVLPAEAATDSEEDVELVRAKLIDLLQGAVPSGVEFRYGDWVEGVTDTGDAVEVTFAGGLRERFDYVVGADGMHSSVRKAVFGPEPEFRVHLGGYFAIVNLPADFGTAGESITFNTPGRQYCVSNYGDFTVGYLGFRSPEIEYDVHDADAQKDLLLKALGDETGWEVPALIQAVRDAPDVYFDSLSQIKMPEWSRGRVVLIGDAAHATSPLSGRGTSLAMLGADFLAAELEKGDHRTGFARYEEQLRPYVEFAQGVAPEARDFMIPATAEALAERNRNFPLTPAGTV
ncbi:FAD-dependent monooxygenase [Amycolatopsis jejuensis]|uniref:FAD-dependent monooxygenase n=1 Tax=Amycolatopsis jejuensis TaxID=330084 RepID=UPI000525AC8B|nr:FAD-dependent monooxygenase [Amycolatopsis jejuensis]